MKKAFSTYTLLLSVVIILSSGCGPGKPDEASTQNKPSETGDLNKVGVQSTGIGESETGCTLPRHCTRETGCLDSACCEAAAQCHEITLYRFNEMAGSDEPGKVYTVAEIRSAMNGHGCSSWIHLNRKPAMNSDIIFTVEQEGQCPDKEAVHYTIQFFRGVVQRNPEKLVFYKAIAHTRPTVIFTGVNELRQRPGHASIVYYDMSELLPNIHHEDPLDNRSTNTHRNDN